MIEHILPTGRSVGREGAFFITISKSSPALTFSERHVILQTDHNKNVHSTLLTSFTGWLWFFPIDNVCGRFCWSRQYRRFLHHSMLNFHFYLISQTANTLSMILISRPSRFWPTSQQIIFETARPRSFSTCGTDFHCNEGWIWGKLLDLSCLLIVFEHLQCIYR